MQIKGIPDDIRHDAWTKALASLGFDLSVAQLEDIRTEGVEHRLCGPSRPAALVVTTVAGHTVRVPLTDPREG